MLGTLPPADREAFAALYRRHLPWLLVRLGRRCSSPAGCASGDEAWLVGDSSGNPDALAPFLELAGRS